jgi:hypothetical protein
VLSRRMGMAASAFEQAKLNSISVAANGMIGVMTAERFVQHWRGC